MKKVETPTHQLKINVTLYQPVFHKLRERVIDSGLMTDAYFEALLTQHALNGHPFTESSTEPQPEVSGTKERYAEYQGPWRKCPRCTEPLPLIHEYFNYGSQQGYQGYYREHQREVRSEYKARLAAIRATTESAEPTKFCKPCDADLPLSRFRKRQLPSGKVIPRHICIEHENAYHRQRSKDKPTETHELKLPILPAESFCVDCDQFLPTAQFRRPSKGKYYNCRCAEHQRQWDRKLRMQRQARAKLSQ